MKTLDQIKAGLAADEFFMVYMPTISLQHGRCVGAEALVRWRHGDELVAPDEFISIAENTPVSGLMTYWIIEQIGRDLGDWLHAHKDVHIGINIPPDTIGRGGLEYAGMKAGLMDITDRLVLEITERGFPDRQALDALEFKRDAKIAIDDFGTGDANIMQMSQMHADIIKLDKFFIDQITAADSIPKIVKGLVAFAQAMNFEIIAEGIEHDYQANALQTLGVHMAQGWHYSKPLSATEFISYHEQRT